jgi:putative drug exporter of the RND superfamily
VNGLTAAADGAQEIAGGIPQLRAGLAALADGLRQLDDGLAQVEAGARALADGLTEARDGARTLRDEVAIPAERAIRDAFRIMTREFTIGLLDPAYLRAVERVGETYGRLTGEDPRTGQQVEPGYDGLASALDELAGGLAEATTGARELAGGAGQLRAGLSEARAGVSQLDDGLALLEAGSRELADGLAQAPAGVRELQTGVGQLREGTRQLRAGADELAQGLRAGVVELEAAGFEELLAGVTGNDTTGLFVLTPGMLELPGVLDQLDLFLTEDRTRTRLLVSPVASPFGPEAQEAVRQVATVAEYSLQGTPLADATVLPAGTSAFLGAIDEAAGRDLVLIIASAGLILAGTFSALMAADLRPLVQMWFAIAAGILIDTLVVRTILGPAIATALGRVNWWPSSRGRNGVQRAVPREAEAAAGP